MSTTYNAPRHALNLPAGSVRALHVLVMTLITCGILWVPSEKIQPFPPFLVYLLFLVVGHFFGSHGVTISADPNQSAKPLHLPGGVVRILVVLVLGGSLAYQYYTAPDRLLEIFKLTLDEMKEQPYVPLLILGGFFLGVFLPLIGRGNSPAWLQDFEAWVSLLALMGLLISALLHVVILPSQPHQYSFVGWNGALGAVVAFYFGERS